MIALIAILCAFVAGCIAGGWIVWSLPDLATLLEDDQAVWNRMFPEVE